MKKTPLYDRHCALGGKIIDFGGWLLPVEYTGIIAEHEQVRNAAGLFDVSHMGEITVKGRDATAFIQKLVTNNILGAKEYQAVYSPMCDPDGGVVDDLLIYKYSNEDYLLIVNAANTDKDYEWLKQNVEGRVEVANVSAAYAQLAIQGPQAESILQKLTTTALNTIKFYHFQPNAVINGKQTIVSRTGYTGEDGFELYIHPQDATPLWDALLAAGKDEGLTPVGLGARDTLRFEAALPLYGNEISATISPLEAGLGKFVKFEKEFFIGREALVKQKDGGLQRKLVGLEMVERGIPRSHYEIQRQDKRVGFVTTGSFSPSLKRNIAMALVTADLAAEGAELDVMIRNRPLKAKVVRLPFYQKKYKRG